MHALGALDPRASILQISKQAQEALLLAVDRLDDLAGTPFTRRAGQAAYDSLPWPTAEALARNVLANIPWGVELAAGFIQLRDQRDQLLRRAEIFAGFDQEGINELLKILRYQTVRSGQILADAGETARRFFLLEEGSVAVLQDGVQIATVREGGYFGIGAIAGKGEYPFTYRAETAVRTLIIDRDRFDPLLRADTTLAQQVSSGARERALLKKMPLFSSLSPQELALVDARLVTRRVAAGDVFVRPNQPRSHLFIIAEGTVEVFMTVDGRNHTLGTLGPGEHFGEYALFADTPYPAGCRALSSTRLLLLDEAKFDELVAACERMTQYVEQIGSSRLINTNRRKEMILA
jgi:CRP-like cAMP-binding protein